jgi:hypothetical protein
MIEANVGARFPQFGSIVRSISLFTSIRPDTVCRGSFPFVHDTPRPVMILAIVTMLQLRDNAARPDRNSVGKTGSPKMIIKLTRRERATILAALRRWLSYPAAREADSIATNGGKQKPLDNAEIERLGRRISELAGKRDAPPVRRQLDNGAHEWKAPGTAR